MHQLHSSMGLESQTSYSRVSATTLMRLVLLLFATCSISTASVAFAQGSGTVTGTVTDSKSSEPVAQSNVTVKGTTIGTATDAAGRFHITGLNGVAGSPVTLTIRRLGYRPTTLTSRLNEANLRVSLDPTTTTLSALVVTGTVAPTKAKELGNSVSQIDAASVMKTAPVRNIEQLITGRAPGALVQVGQGGSPGTGGRIKLRGSVSLSLTDQPLIYVDGVRVDNAVATGPANAAFGGAVSRLNDYSPEDIESLEIVKGPAASTLYGTEAANGVIQIITKKGHQGATRWSATIRQGSTWFSDAENRFPTVYGLDAANTIISRNPYEEAVLQSGRKPFGTGYQQGYEVNASGGTDAMRFFVSGAHNNDDGYEPSTGVKDYHFRGNLQLKASKRLDVSLLGSYITGRTLLPADGSFGGSTYALLNFRPARLTLATKGWDFGSPYDNQRVWRFGQDVNHFIGGIQTTARPLSWLTSRVNVGFDRVNELNDQTTGRLAPDLAAVFGTVTASGRRDIRTRIANTSSADWIVSAAGGSVDRFKLTSTVGAQYVRKEFHLLGEIGTSLPAAGVYTISSASIIQATTESIEQNATLGSFAQQEIGWRDRVFLTLGLRVDNNSAFGSNLDWVRYPKASLSWVLSEEPFWRFSNAVSAFKFRMAYGETGQQPTAFAALRTYSPSIGPGGASAVTPNTTGNPDLKPERGKELEGGFDATFGEDRASFEFTMYNKRTYDGIFAASLPPSGGFPGTRFTNIGQIQNRGIEMLFRSTLFDTRNADLDLTVNFAHNKSKVIKVGNAQGFINNGSYRQQEGFPVASFFNRKVIGASFNPTTKKAENVVCDDGMGGGVACANAPSVFNGNTIPTKFGSVSPSLRLFGWLQLSTLVDFQLGFNREDGTHQSQCTSGFCRENFYPEEFDVIKIAELQNGLLDDFSMRKADFYKLREIGATATLPGRIARLMTARAATLTLAVRNLHTWTDFTGLDPEAYYVSQQYFPGNFNISPPASTLMAKINLSF